MIRRWAFHLADKDDSQLINKSELFLFIRFYEKHKSDKERIMALIRQYAQRTEAPDSKPKVDKPDSSRTSVDTPNSRSRRSMQEGARPRLCLQKRNLAKLLKACTHPAPLAPQTRLNPSTHSSSTNLPCSRLPTLTPSVRDVLAREATRDRRRRAGRFRSGTSAR